MKSQQMAGDEQRQYHIGLAPGELGDHVLLCGDPARARRFSERFLEKTEEEISHREYLTFTGLLAGARVSAMATGIGPDNVEIAVVESCNIAKGLTFIRMGSCGALQGDIAPGDLVVSTGAVRLENTSSFFVPDGYPAVADLEVTTALTRACRARGYTHHVGITATAPGFYGAQGRNVGVFRPRKPELVDELARCGVLNFEMESSTLFTLAALARLRAGTVCAVYANRATDEVLDQSARLEAEARCLEVAADAVRLLCEGRAG